MRIIDSLEKRLWCWEGLGAGGEGDDRGWDGWMASPTRWTWVWVNSGSWWWTGRPGVLWFMGSQRVRHDWAAELNWSELKAWEPGMSVVNHSLQTGEDEMRWWAVRGTNSLCTLLFYSGLPHWGGQFTLSSSTHRQPETHPHRHTRNNVSPGLSVVCLVDTWK